MHNDRRDFVFGAGALLATSVGTGAIALAAAGPQGPPRTKAGLEDYLGQKGGKPEDCVRTVETIEGPFYYPSSLERRNISENRPGLKLRLALTITGSFRGFCPPLTGALVDIWHTDASTMYSNVGADIQVSDTVGQTFCRGHQFTDDNGYVEFDTIVPGWEILAAPLLDVARPGAVMALRRATHIHVKVFKNHSIANYQLYLPDPFLTALYSDTEPYRSHRVMTAPGLDKAYERVANTEDRLFNESNPAPIAIQRKGDMLLATARIGLPFENSAAGRESLWR